MAKTLVRLKPYNKHRNHVMRVYVHGPTSKKFEERRGWYTVDPSMAKYLSSVRQIEGDEDSPLAFDVCTQAEAKAIDQKEKKEVVRRAEAGEANDLTTGDLGGRRRADAAREAPSTRRRGPESKSVRGPRSMVPVQSE